MPCPVCDQRAAETFLEIPSAPTLCNTLSATREQAIDIPRGRIELSLCRACRLIYNAAFDPALVEYQGTYENALHFSVAFRDYAARSARALVDQHGLRGKDILEIGCGDGYFLSALCTLGGNRGIGFDPAHDPQRSMIDPASNAQVRRELYRPEAGGHPSADWIIARHILEHIPSPRAFLTSLRAGLRPGGAAWFEVPHAGTMLKEGLVWDVLYEHCTYYSEAPLTTLFHICGFPFARTAPDYDGQYLTLLARPEPPPHSDPEPLPEPTASAPSIDDAHRFGEMYRAKVGLWRRRLERLGSAKVILWGAGTKGISFLNALAEHSAAVHAVIDVNPRKWGHFTAGTGHEILPPVRLAETGADVVILANPIYRAEVSAQLEDLGLRPQVAVL